MVWIGGDVVVILFVGIEVIVGVYVVWCVVVVFFVDVEVVFVVWF